MSSLPDSYPSKRVKRDGNEFKSSGTVNYNVISDKVIEGSRFEREKQFKIKENEKKVDSSGQQNSSTFEDFRRLAAGLDARTVADKIADPNRPTWEQYKKDNADKLDMTGADQKKMLQYRAELDRNRELLLSKGSSSKKTAAISDSEDSESSGSHARHKRKRKKQSKSHSHKRKHEKKEKKHKDRRD